MVPKAGVLVYLHVRPPVPLERIQQESLLIKHTLTHRCTVLVVLFLALRAAAFPTSTTAQVDSASLHATLSLWDESNWLQFLNRDAADGGRLSSLGILQRFHEDIDFEYQIDRLAAGFSMTEDYAWYRLERNGVRWSGASITKRDLLSGAQFKTAVPIGKSWNFRLQFDREVSPTTNRNRLRFEFDKSWGSGVFAYGGGSLDPVKPDSDLELGIGWRSAATGNPRHEARLTLAVVDWSSNLIYLGLNAAKQPQVDSTLAYDRQPLALHGSVSSAITRTVRLEVFGMAATPSTIDQYEGLNRDQGIRQEEEFGFVGGLVEWSARPNLRIGGFATYVRAQTERSALSEGLGVDEYRLIEETTNVGAFALYGIGRQWHMEAFIARNRRPEEREYRNGTLPDVDYLDQAWTGQVVARRTTARGLVADLGILWDVRDVVRGDGQVPSAGTLGWHSYRLNAMAGWRFNSHVMFLLGAGLDLDGDRSGSSWFDGVRARLTVLW
jgi:hypothetical protein